MKMDYWKKKMNISGTDFIKLLDYVWGQASIKEWLLKDRNLLGRKAAVGIMERDVDRPQQFKI